MATTPSSAATVGQQAGSPYLRLFRLPGAKAFCISGAIARLPISMMSLGIVLALNHLYDNWTIAGTMSAVYILAVSAVTPFYARLFDRLGQRRVGFPVLALQVASMLVFAFAAMARVPIAVLVVLAVLMGLCQFSIGALVRTRNTKQQARLSDDERRVNMIDAFAAIEPVEGRRVLLVDDVCTTGASATTAWETLSK